MWKYGLLLFLLTNYKFTNACEIVCGFPSKFDTNSYILEGKVIGYVGNFQKNDTEGEFGGLIVKVTKSIYAPQVVKVFNLFVFGIGTACEKIGANKETLKEKIPIGTSLTVVANTIELNNNIMGINLVNHICSPIFYSKMKKKSNYSFEKSRKNNITIRRLYKDYQENLHDSGDEIIKKATKEAKKLYKVSNSKKTNEGFQFYLALLSIHKARNEEKRYKILEKLIWSNYIERKTFIDEQDINEDMKAALKLKFDEIQKEWAYY